MTERTHALIPHQHGLGLGYRRAELTKRLSPVRAVVVHTTGGGINKRFAREGWAKGDPYPFYTAVRVYSTIMSASGHYVVGQLGECAQLVPEDVIAHHVGGAKARPYINRHQWPTTGATPGLGWWGERWPEFHSPAELAGGLLWDGGSCNRNTIGIEVVPPAPNARGEWSDECLDTLARLVDDVCTGHGIPFDEYHVVTHSDAPPISRTARGLPWDPGPGAWSRASVELLKGRLR